MDPAQRNVAAERTAPFVGDRLGTIARLGAGGMHVLAAWVVSRVIAVSALVLGGSPGLDRLTFGWLNGWDGSWYLRVAHFGYSDAPNAFGQTNWPFFPLLPALTRVLHTVGIPWNAASVLVANAAFLVALAGVWRLASRHLSPRGAALAVWALALFPTSITFAMGYPSSLFLAGAVWSFIFVEERRDLAAGGCAAVATLARPNGLTVAVALVVAVWLRDRANGQQIGPTSVASAASLRRGGPAASMLPAVLAVAGPSAVVFGVWCSLLWRWAGEPLIFWSAKSGWDEITVFELIADASLHGVTRAAWPHVICGVVAFAALIATWTRLRLEWRVLAVLSLVPPLLTGVVGLGRYAADCFPVFLAIGMLLDRAPAPVRPAALVLGAAGLGYFGVLVARFGFVP